MADTKEYPGVKVYMDAAGHQREAHPQRSRSGDWFYIWSWAGCTDECPACNSDEQDDYCGEREYED